jgi:AbrB family looped-hinge helix DNA binding protein
MGSTTRRVGERGQITIPKEIRDRFDISGGDEVVVHAEDGRIVVEKPLDEDEVAAGYRRRAERSLALEDELAAVSAEADVGFGDAPEW